MTQTVNAATLTTLIPQITSDALAEALLDQSINKICGNGYDLDNLVAGEGTYTAAEAGWIVDVAIALYANTKTSGSQSENFTMGSMGYGSSNASSAGASTVNDLAKEAARALNRIVNDPPVYIANAPVEET